MEDLRNRSANRTLNRIDPIYLLLDKVVFKSFFKPPKQNSKKYEVLDYAEIDFLVENLRKHRLIIWINVVVAIFLFVYGLEKVIVSGNESIVMIGLLSSALIAGMAWFSVSFAGIPEKFISIAFPLTFAIYLSFTFSMTFISCLMITITPWAIGLIVILPIYISLYFASIFYDNVDGLKIGLDSTLLKFSRATLNYYSKYGYVTKDESSENNLEGESEMKSENVGLLRYYLNAIERNVNQLEEDKELIVANHLLATTIDLFLRMINLGKEANEKLSLGSEYESYRKESFSQKQEDTDKLSTEYLLKIIKQIKSIFENNNSEEIKRIEENLTGYMQSVNSIDSIFTDGRERQKFADLIFSQSFRQLHELLSTNRHILLRNMKK